MRQTQGDGAGHGGGGLGHIGVESLKALTAATIIVLDRDQAALELVRGYGADHTVLDRARRRQRGRQAPGVDRRAERRGRLRLLGEQGAETKG
jgi:D-arabinose 1-dehydrogenase-like Zn-dependent alcohol dehydrogenase